MVLDCSVLMPNHFHAVVRLPPGGRLTLGRVLGAFKSLTTRAVNAHRGTPGARLWHRGYFDRVVRDEAELAHVRGYVRRNPIPWARDRLNPEFDGRPLRYPAAPCAEPPSSPS